MTTSAGPGHLDQNERCLQENPVEASDSTLHTGNQAGLTPLKRGSKKTRLHLQHSQAGAIVFAAVNITDLAEREKFIEAACHHDAELRIEIERVFHNHFAPDSPFFTAQTALLDAEEPPTGEVPPRQPQEFVGPYQLLMEIGEGGMGKVFLAEQFVPIRRRVALKMIKPGMNSSEVIGRFDVERQALAQMEHPFIAMVLDAGVSQSGTPYFVMEYVQGLQITEYCDVQKLSLSDRVRLFIDVCHGIKHAHQKGIIHRDLKSSNVLVTSLDGCPVPKIIDFGIAKAVSQAQLSRSVHTSISQVVGTALYMSPEQARISPDIDTRSDVYSLGVLLYELLTGSLPVGKEILALYGEEEVRRIVREEDPPLPSNRLASLALETCARIAANRGLTPQALRHSLQGDLDNIVMKALEKEPDQRYESASSLAEDLHRYLKHEPVLASPPSRLYRARKFFRRKRGAILTTAAVTLSLFLGLGIAAWQAIRANFNADQFIAQEALTAKQSRLTREQRLRAEVAEAEHRKVFERAQELVYASSVSLASRHLQTGDSEQANRLLEAWIPTQGTTDRRGIEWHLLRGQRSNFGEELLQLGHDVSSVRISPDNTYLVTGTDGGLIWKYSLVENRPLDCWSSRLEDIRRMAFNENGSLLAIVSYQAEVVVLDTKSGETVLRCPPPEFPTKNAAACFFRGSLLTSGNRNHISVWDLDTGHRSHLWSMPCELILDIACTGDQSFLAVLCDYGTDEMIRVNLMTEVGQNVPTRLIPLGFQPNSIAIHPDSKHIAVGGVRGELEIWDSRTSVQIRKWTLVEKLNELSFSPDGKFLAVAERSGAIHVVDWRNAEKPSADQNHRGYFHWAAHPRPARSVVFTADGRHVISAGFDGRVIKWPRVKNPTARLTVGEKPWDMVTLPSMAALASFCDERLQLHSLADLQPVTEITLSSEHGPICAAVASASGNRLAVSTRSKTILVGKTEPHLTLLPVAKETSQGNNPPIVSFLSDEVTLVGIDTFPELRVQAWNCDNRQRLFSYSLSNVVPHRLTFDGNDTMWTVTDSSLLQIKLRTGEILRKLPIQGRDAGRIAASGDGQTLAVTYSDRRIELVDADSHAVQSTIFGHVGTVEKLLFTNDGKTLLALDAGHNLRFWNVSTGTELLSWHFPVRAFDLSSDNKTLTIFYEDQFERFDLTSRE